MTTATNTNDRVLLTTAFVDGICKRAGSDFNIPEACLAYQIRRTHRAAQQHWGEAWNQVQSIQRAAEGALRDLPENRTPWGFNDAPRRYEREIDLAKQAASDLKDLLYIAARMGLIDGDAEYEVDLADGMKKS